MTDAAPHRAYVESDQSPPESGWGRSFLAQCEIDPDDPTDVRDAYEACRAQYGLWLWRQTGDIDDEAYYMLVDAIKDLYGREAFPLDWPAPILVRMAQPFRNALKRKPGYVAPACGDAAAVNPVELAALVERTMCSLLGGLPNREIPGGAR